MPIIRRASEHGLGHILAPKGESKQSWIDKFWKVMICEHLGRPHSKPAWFRKVALVQLTISTPNLIAPLRAPTDKQSGDGAWPFNFILVGYPKAATFWQGRCVKHNLITLGCKDSSPCKIRSYCPIARPLRPVAAYDRQVEDPETLHWIDAHTGKTVRVVSGNSTSEMGAVALKTFGDVYREFVDHVDQKAADECGLQPKPGHAGELQPLHVVEAGRDFTGKEARQLETTQIFGNAADQYLFYNEGWNDLKARLCRFPRGTVVSTSGLSRSQVYELLRESSSTIPEQGTIAILTQTLGELEREPHRRVDK